MAIPTLPPTSKPLAGGLDVCGPIITPPLGEKTVGLVVPAGLINTSPLV